MFELVTCSHYETHFILFLEVILKFKSQRYKSQKISGLSINLVETSPEDKYWNETNSYIMITNIYPSGNCWHVARRPHDFCAIALWLPQDDRPMSVRFYGPCKGIVSDLAGSLRLSQESTIIVGPKWQSKTLRCPHDHRAVRCVYGQRAYDFFKFVIVRS